MNARELAPSAIIILVFTCGFLIGRSNSHSTPPVDLSTISLEHEDAPEPAPVTDFRTPDYPSLDPAERSKILDIARQVSDYF